MILGSLTSTLESGIFEQNLTINKNNSITILVIIENIVANLIDKIESTI